MAKQIEGVYENVLIYAKEEFLNKGYIDASLREIAKAAGTSTGSIYTRFKDKEGLFQALVEPVVQGMKNIFLEIQEKFHHMDNKKQEKNMESYSEAGMKEILDYMYDHYDEFRLLLDASYGTKFQNFLDEMIDMEVEYTYKYMNSIGCIAIESGVITENFLHIAVSGYFNAMFEVIRHKMNKIDAQCYIKMLQKYHMAGFNTILYRGN